MTKFKICGLTDLNNAIMVREANADFMGFIFVPGSKRKLDLKATKKLIDSYRDLTGSGGPALVGLFANQPLNYVNGIVEQCGFEYVQLCGDESPEYWSQINAKIFKSIGVEINNEMSENRIEILKQAKLILESNAIPLFDRFEEGQLGGTGKSFDWTNIEGISGTVDFILAGGLTPENINHAIKQVKPWCVDVSSGVETEGKKDPIKILKFSEEIKSLSKD